MNIADFGPTAHDFLPIHKNLLPIHKTRGRHSDSLLHLLSVQPIFQRGRDGASARG
jgi:hypothetical protein